MAPDHWPTLHGFNYNVEEWDESDNYQTLAICRTFALARASFKAIWMMTYRQKTSGLCARLMVTPPLRPNWNSP